MARRTTKTMASKMAESGREPGKDVLDDSDLADDPIVSAIQTLRSTIDDLQFNQSAASSSINVTTNLSVASSTGARVIASSDGTNATIPVATTDVSGVISTAIFDRIAVNSAKNTNADQDLSGLALKTAITGSFTVASASFSTRVTLNDAKVTNADQSKADINALDITEVGTISSGVWNGTKIASAYLDDDTMHLSGNQTVGGNKTFSGDMLVNAKIRISDTTEVTDSTGNTGALRVEGGISSAGHIYAEGLMSQMGRAEIDSETSRLFPIGHYSTGKDVFSIDPTWTEQQLQEYFDDTNVTWATESDAPAGYSILITGGVNVGIPYASGFPLIPIDDTSIYFTECWIKNVGTDQRHYMGTAEKKEDFGNPSSGQGNPGSFGYHVMSNTLGTTSWVRQTGYITGRSDGASGAFETDANYFSPLALFNYGAGSGTRACIISGWRIIKIDKQEYFNNGTAALPAITNYDDPNTGISFQAADTVNISTGGTNRLTINATKSLFAAEVEAGSLDINGNADISGDLTGLDNITSTNYIIGSHTIDDIDITSEFVDADAHLMSSKAIGARFSLKAGSTSITTLGTIGTGVWEGTTIKTAYIADANISMAKLANIATDTFIGRTASSAGVPKALSKTEALAILNVENGATADQSDAEILTAIEDGVDSVHYKDGSIDTDHIADDQVTAAKLANSINSAIAANTAKNTNADQSKADINALDITEVGTISSGVWQGTTIKTAYIGDDQVTADKLADSINSAIAANTNKTVLVVGTGSGNAKAGNTTTISSGQASAISANTSKVGFVTTMPTATESVTCTLTVTKNRGVPNALVFTVIDSSGRSPVTVTGTVALE